jgi:hypothetical protein
MSEGRLTWTASPSADVLGYEIEVDGKVVGTSVETSAAAPAGGGKAVSVRARLQIAADRKKRESFFPQWILELLI